jgi:hypothetical protein
MAFQHQESVAECVQDRADDDGRKNGKDNYDENVVDHVCFPLICKDAFHRVPLVDELIGGTRWNASLTGKGPEQETAVEQREGSPHGNPRKATFRLRLRAGLTAPNRVWDLNP